MAFVIIPAPVPTDAVRWAAIPLAGDCLALSDDSHDPVRGLAPGQIAAAPVRLLRLRQAGHEQWALMARPGARVMVNGSPVPNGLRVLDDHTEIRLGFQRLFLSLEALAERVPYPGETPGSCPVCRRSIVPGSMVVRCPGSGCGLFHHAPDGKQWCWGYLPKCACGQPTDADAGLSWLPAD